MLYEKFICLLLFSLASVYLIYKKPTRITILLLITIYVGILLYKDDTKRPLEFKVCVLVSIIIIVLVLLIIKITLQV